MDPAQPNEAEGGDMIDPKNWDWESGEKRIPFGEWSENYRWVEEPYVSTDGEKIAAIVNIDEGMESQIFTIGPFGCYRFGYG